MLQIELHSLPKQWQQPVVIGKQRENLQQCTVLVSLSILIYGAKNFSSLPFFLNCCMTYALHFVQDASTIIKGKCVPKIQTAKEYAK